MRNIYMRSKFIDITNHRFGKITALEHISHGNWKCICDCGTVKTINSSNLRSTKPIQSCGGTCRLIDRTGEKYGMLLVLNDGGRSKQGTRLWDCVCNCGNTIKIRDSHLERGQQSCGCLNIKEMLGKKFGKLTVVDMDRSIKDTSRVLHWKCLCDCGNLSIVRGSSLRENITLSCGCIRREHQYETIRKEAFKIHKKGAIDRDYVSELTFVQYIDIGSRPCVYCNKISKRRNRDTGAVLELNSIDRIDNEPYYNLENTQSVCFVCQVMKLDMTDKEFREHLVDVFKNLEINQSSISVSNSSASASVSVIVCHS
jgi:hypothetical protein